MPRCRQPRSGDGPAVQAGVRRDRDEPAAQYGSSPDSPLEGDGFELPVPRENGHSVEPSSFLYLSETAGLPAGGKWIRTCMGLFPVKSTHCWSERDSNLGSPQATHPGLHPAHGISVVAARPSHSPSFDQRLRVRAPLTAIARALRCPRRTTKRLPRVTPV